MSLDREEFLAGFLVEADEHLGAASQNLLALESAIEEGRPQTRLVRELFRSLHTLKGLAAMVEVEPIVELAHELEVVLREADRGGRRLTAPAVELLFQGVRALGPQVQAVAANRPVPTASRELLARLAALGGKTRPAPASAPELVLDDELRQRLGPGDLELLTSAAREGRRAWQLEFVPSAERAADGVTITSVREALARLAEIVKVIPRSSPRTPENPGGLTFLLLVTSTADPGQLAAAAHAPTALALDPQPTAPDPRPQEQAEELAEEPAEEPASTPGPAHSRVVRVEIDRLDEALDRVADLVVGRFRLVRAVEQLRERGADVRELSALLGETSRQLRDLRGAILRTRMVPASELLERLPLLVRGLGQRTGRRVRLEIAADEVELDKGVAERLFPALVHLVRNAVDHGLEPPEERARAGKPEQGLVRVSCRGRSDTQLELEVADDGRGVDAQAVARRAGQPAPTDPERLLELLCRPGISTRESATTTSGQGMGMDIVKRTVEALGGELLLRTRPGEGTTFTILAPLSVSIVDTFSFECAAQRFVVPVAVVEEIVALDQVPLLTAPGTRRSSLLELRGEVVPLVGLAPRFALGEGHGRQAIVVRRKGQPWAFGVDRVIAQQEVVLRPLEDPLVRVPGVSGTTDLGDGRPTLVVDLPALAGQEVGP